MISVRLIAGVPLGLSPSSFHAAARADGVTAKLAVAAGLVAADLSVAGWGNVPARAAPRFVGAASGAQTRCVQPGVPVLRSTHDLSR